MKKGPPCKKSYEGLIALVDLRVASTSSSPLTKSPQ